MGINHSKMLRRKAIQSFMDVLVLSEVNEKPLGGYEIIQNINEKFHIVMSPATVYSSLYSMERKGLLKASFRERTRIYELTEQGREDLQFWLRASEAVESFIADVSEIEV